MEKHGFLVYLGMVFLAMVFSFTLVSANTLVGGKIYNSDYTDVVEGAKVTVDCGGDILNTYSLSDGSYAVVFHKGNCYNADEVEVSALKGELYGEETSLINNSSEEGEFVSIANVNIILPSTKYISKEKDGSWFMCGNGVCDSGETYATCPDECENTDIIEEEEEIEEVISSPGENNQEEVEEEVGTQIEENTENTAGVTGAVIGDGNSNRNSNFLFWLGGVVLFLIIAIAIIAYSKGRKDMLEKDIPKKDPQTNFSEKGTSNNEVQTVL